MSMVKHLFRRIMFTKNMVKIFSAVGLENPVPEGLLDQATIWLQK